MNVSSPNSTRLLVDKLLPQCDYTQLFSHLPLSFQFIQEAANQQLLTAASFPNTVTSTASPPTLDFLQVQYQQRSACKLGIALLALFTGLFYSLTGYRCLKLATFGCGLALASSLVYLILSEQRQLTIAETLCIAGSVGVLFAFVALLVQYIGLFLLGIASSTAVVTCALILIDLVYTNKSAWLCIGLLFVSATVIASVSLRFQKTLAVFNTSCIGAGLLLVAVDFFVENNLLVDYIVELYKVCLSTTK